MMRSLRPARAGNQPMLRRLVLAALAVVTAAACAAEPQAQAGGLPASPAAAQSSDIRHVIPAPDSVGPQPTRFEWTPVQGAESYTLRVWNDVDVNMLSATGLTTTAVDVPAEPKLPLGTYFWAVMAMRGDRPLAESGMAAFVVMQ